MRKDRFVSQESAIINQQSAVSQSGGRADGRKGGHVTILIEPQHENRGQVLEMNDSESEEFDPLCQYIVIVDQFGEIDVMIGCVRNVKEESKRNKTKRNERDMTKTTNDDHTPHRKLLKIKEIEIDADARLHEVHEVHEVHEIHEFMSS
jgi:hypothetical protein